MNLNYGTNEMTGGELINLLCIIHRDGGHYIQQHGLEKAYVDAVNILNRWKTLPDELETERMKVVACGVVAMANTRETAEEARKMRPEYRSASLGDVERAVDCEMQYREELAEREKQFAQAQMYALGKKLLLEERKKQIVILRDAVESDLRTYNIPRTALILEALDATADQLEAISDMDARPERSGRSMNNPYGRDGLMAIAAVRYCLGCMSYIVGDCVDWLAEAWPELQESTRKTIQRDIEEAFKMDDEWREAGNKTGRLGMDMDRAEWGRARRLWVTSFITMKR